MSLVAASIPRIKRFLGVGGSGMLCPQIHESELSHSQRSLNLQQSNSNEPKLVPYGTGRSRVTISSKGSNMTKKTRHRPEWQGFVTMGTKEDEHTSTSSLFDHDEQTGVIMQHELRVSLEENSVRT